MNTNFKKLHIFTNVKKLTNCVCFDSNMKIIYVHKNTEYCTKKNNWLTYLWTTSPPIWRFISFLFYVLELLKCKTYLDPSTSLSNKEPKIATKKTSLTIHQPTYIPCYLPTYLTIYLPTYIPSYLPT